MSRTLLLTSFATWLDHQPSNSSDDLLELLGRRDGVHYLRRLPVDYRQAPRLVLERIEQLRPDVVLLCGMAEARSRLNVESRAVVDGETLVTPLDLAALTRGLSVTDISHDAGRFVCNDLYYRLLCHHRDQGLARPCLFVHVPLLTEVNRQLILADFQSLIHRLATLPLPEILQPS